MHRLLTLAFLTPSLCLSCDDQPTGNPDADSQDKSTTSKRPDPTKSSSKREITQSNRKPRANRAQIISAKTTMSQLGLAVDAFYDNYQFLPGSDKKSTDATVTTTTPLSSSIKGSPIMAALLGLQSARDENPNSIPFFTTKSAQDGKDGLIQSKDTAELVDPWGNPYRLVMNYDYDNQIIFLPTNETFFDVRFIIWSPGPDGQSGTPETNQDNIYSWNQE